MTWLNYDMIVLETNCLKPEETILLASDPENLDPAGYIEKHPS